MIDTKQSIFDPLLCGSSPWCQNCMHHVNCHNTGEIPLCNYKTAGSIVDCNCKEFVSMSSVKEKLE